MANALQSRGQHVQHKAAHELDDFQAYQSLGAVLVGALRSAKLAQRISQGGCQGRCCRLGRALQLGQARQQVQRVDVLWRAEPPARWKC